MARKNDGRTAREEGDRRGSRRASEPGRSEGTGALKAPGRGEAARSSPGSGTSRTDDGGAARGGSSRTSAARARSGRADLRKDLREFASARPQGWSHEDWLSFLESLKERGHNIVDREAIGAALERERLDLRLEEVRGVGPQRRQALVERFGSVWSLRDADAREIAAAAGMPLGLAEQVKERLP